MALIPLGAEPLYIKKNISHYPLKWKVANITVLKKHNKETNKTQKSFRPISFLNTLGKIFEKIIYERINWLSKENMWLKDNQHGFREEKGTESAMHSLAQTIEGNFSKKEYTTLLFLDISGAFDCAWPFAILAALAKRKCPGYLIRLIKSLFENRMACLMHGHDIFLYQVMIVGNNQTSPHSTTRWLPYASYADRPLTYSHPMPF